MKVLITGATGYIGHQIALAAAQKYDKVHVPVRNPHSEFLPTAPNIIPFKCDISDRSSLATAMAGCHHVIHSAGLTRLYSRDKNLFYRINVQGTRNVLEAALQHNVLKFVFTSSCAVLGPSYKYPVTENDPRITPFENDYEISKHWAELEVLQYFKKGLNTVIASPSRVYGPGLATPGNPITAFIKKSLRRKFAFMPSRASVKGNYVFIDDVVNGHFLCLDKGISGEKYNLGGENISYQEFFSSIKQYGNINIIKLPLWSLQLVSLFEMAGSLLLKRPTQLSPAVIKRFFENREVSSAKAVEELGYVITPFNAGLKKTLADASEL
jgi:nucleoside-diphosphate-sugar epimerase